MAAFFLSLRSLLPILSLLVSLVSLGRAQMYSTVEIEVDGAKHDEQFFTYFSRPDIDSPRWDVKIFNRSALAPGYWFVTPYGKVKQTDNDKKYVGAAIYDDDGELIWNGGPDFHYFDTFTFKVSQFHGSDHLTLLHPRGSQGVIMNYKYEVDRHERVGLEGTTTNMHEFQLIEDGHSAMYLTTFVRRASHENSARVGYDGRCNAAFLGFQERKTGSEEVVFDWQCEDHIPLNESYRYRDGDLSQEIKGTSLQDLCAHDNFDYLHLNSVEKLADGDYLLSGRDTYTLYKVSHVDGSIVWRLGGKTSDFTFPDGTNFTGQHDARCVFENSTHMTISLMDNALGTAETDVGNANSRGLLLSVDLEAMEVRELMAYNHPYGPGGYAHEGGNFQTLPNGNVFMSWQTAALHSEHSPDGTVLSQAHLPAGLKTYRSFKFPWVGQPRRPPDIHSQVMKIGGVDHTIVHASWNGATEVKGWRLYETDPDGMALRLLNTTERTGFETMIVFPHFVPFVHVDAVGADGEKLERSDSHHCRTIAIPGSSGSHLPTYFHHNWRDTFGPVFGNPVVAFVCGLVFYKFVTMCCRGRGKRGFPWPGRQRGVSTLHDYEEGVEDDALLEKTNGALDGRTLHED